MPGSPHPTIDKEGRPVLVRMKQFISGARDGEPWPLAGGTIDVPDHEGADLVANGYAKEVTDGDAPAPADPSGAEDGDGGAADETPEPSGDEGGTVTGTEAVKPTRRRTRKAV